MIKRCQDDRERIRDHEGISNERAVILALLLLSEQLEEIAHLLDRLVVKEEVQPP